MKISVEEIGGKKVTIIRKPFDAEWARESLAMGVPIVAEGNDGWKCFVTRKFYHNKEMELFSCKAIIDPCGSVDGCFIADVGEEYLAYTINVLPALSKRPTPEDAALLYRYMAEGIYFTYSYDDYDYEGRDTTNTIDGSMIYELINRKAEIIHAIDTDGTRVEVAIQGGGE